MGQKLNVFKSSGAEVTSNSVLLDFGCGSGRYVQELREQGYQAFGCDIEMKKEDDVDTDTMVKNGVIRKIDYKNYILPFNDNTFDFIFSDQVFEHVWNYSETISEISRVLKPDGTCLHVFPSRYKLIESHVFIPFASVIKSYWWIRLWVSLGIRNEWTGSNTIKEISVRYLDYLRNNTNYLSKKELFTKFSSHFKHVSFCENEFLKSSTRGKYFGLMPLAAYIYSTFRMRVILTKSPY
jgi:SAM-dependent methyltransferase